MEVSLLSAQSLCYRTVQDIRLKQNKQICEMPGSHSPLWRPWIMTARDIDSQRLGRQNSPFHMGQVYHESEAISLFTHPVRLMWPRSKCFDYLYSEGQELLSAFPVQATISFYIESDTDEEDEEFNEEDELEEESAIEETVLGKITEQKSQQL